MILPCLLPCLHRLPPASPSASCQCSSFLQLSAEPSSSLHLAHLKAASVPPASRLLQPPSNLQPEWDCGLTQGTPPVAPLPCHPPPLPPRRSPLGFSHLCTRAPRGWSLLLIPLSPPSPHSRGSSHMGLLASLPLHHCPLACLHSHLSNAVCASQQPHSSIPQAPSPPFTCFLAAI